MKMDMTYREIEGIKLNIKQFLDEIQKIAKLYQFEYSQQDRDFLFIHSINILFFLNIYIKGRRNHIFIKY